MDASIASAQRSRKTMSMLVSSDESIESLRLPMMQDHEAAAETSTERKKAKRPSENRDNNAETASSYYSGPSTTLCEHKERMRRRLQFFFMNPIEKWQARRKFPYKFVVQVIYNNH